jgi:hypothetical protein
MLATLSARPRFQMLLAWLGPLAPAPPELYSHGPSRENAREWESGEDQPLQRDLSDKEIAEVLGMNENNVRVQRSLAKKRLGDLDEGADRLLQVLLTAYAA